MLTIRKHKCGVVLVLSALAATIIVDANFVADSLTSSSAEEDNGDNLLQNGGFEESDSGWGCELCTQKSLRNSDSHSGAYSYQVISSESGKPTLNQKLSVTPGTRYVLGGYIKLKELPSGKIFQRLELHVRFYRSKDLPQPPKQTCADQIKFCHFIPNVCADLTAARTICKKICNICDNDLVFVSTLPMVQPDFGWQEIGGDIMIPSDVTRMSVYFTFYGPSGNFLVDDVIVTKLSDNVNWKKMADARIEKYRKSDINIKIHGGNQQDQDLRIKIEQKSHDYPFGTAVNTEAMLNGSLRKYQDFVYKNFNWAVLENALKWSKTEEKQGVITTGKQVKALKKLKKRGISVRGHAVFWDVLVWGVQPWVASLTKDQLTDAMNRRYDIVKVTKGKVKHWDVNNENLHGDFYETKLQNANISMDMFKAVHSIDHDVELFLNDFDIVLKTSHRTVAVKNQGKRFHESGVPIHGIGIQSHLRDGDVDITAIKHRLDKVAEAGLPVWITELSYNHPDEMKRAEGYEDVFRLYFSHPAIDGILIWGYWDRMIFQIDAAIATGPNVVPNEAGRRILNLLKKEWWTNMTLDLSSNHHTIRGFHGNYEITVLKNGKKVTKKSFALPKSRKTIDIHLHITEGFHLDIC